MGERPVPPARVHRRRDGRGRPAPGGLAGRPAGQGPRPPRPGRARGRPAAAVPDDAADRLRPPGQRPPGLHLHRRLAGHGRHARPRARLRRRRGDRPPDARRGLHRASGRAVLLRRGQAAADARARRAAAPVARRLLRLQRLGLGHPDAARRRPSGGRQPRRSARPRRRAGGVAGPALRDAGPATEDRRGDPGRGRGRAGRPPGGRPAGAGVSLAELTPEQRDVRDLARRFGEEAVAPHAAAWDREHRFPREVFQQLGELGLMGVCVPEELGGAGADYLTYVLVLEELSRADAGVGVTLAVHTGAGTLPLIAHGSDEQRDRLVPPLAQGHEIAAFALTESGSGSDAGAMLTRADDGSGGIRITGTKQWITNGSHAHVFTVFAKRDGKVSAYVVRRGAQGFRVTREEDKLGLHSSSTADLAFEDTPAEPLGAPGAGMRIALSTLDGGRIGIAAQAVGIAQAALDVASAYAKERSAFGGPIARFQAISHKLADMQTEIEAARALTYRAARLKEAGRPHTVEGAQAKLFASAVARRQTGEAIQVLGGYGYTKEFPAERYYRDAKVTELYEGTSEIQRLVIARGLLGELAG